MDRDRKTRILARTENARLEELLILFGCGDEIAPLDAAVKRKRLFTGRSVRAARSISGRGRACNATQADNAA